MARTKGYAERVNVLKKVRVNGSWKLASVLERNGKIVRDHVLISGNDEYHPEGGYYLEWYQEGKRRRQAVGDFSEVVEAVCRKSIEVNAQKVGLIKASQGPEQHRVTIGQAIDKYLDFIKAHRKQRTYVTYRYTPDKLLKQSCQRSFVDQVTREDILQFMTDCYRCGLGKRTVYDKLVVVLQLFKRHGKTKLIEPSDGQTATRSFARFTKRKKLQPCSNVRTRMNQYFSSFFSVLAFGIVRSVMWLGVTSIFVTA